LAQAVVLAGRQSGQGSFTGGEHLQCGHQRPEVLGNACKATMADYGDSGIAAANALQQAQQQQYVVQQLQQRQDAVQQPQQQYASQQQQQRQYVVQQPLLQQHVVQQLQRQRYVAQQPQQQLYVGQQAQHQQCVVQQAQQRQYVVQQAQKDGGTVELPTTVESVATDLPSFNVTWIAASGNACEATIADYGDSGIDAASVAVTLTAAGSGQRNRR